MKVPFPSFHSSFPHSLVSVGTRTLKCILSLVLFASCLSTPILMCSRVCLSSISPSSKVSFPVSSWLKSCCLLAECSTPCHQETKRSPASFPSHPCRFVYLHSVHEILSPNPPPSRPVHSQDFAALSSHSSSCLSFIHIS